MSAAGRYSVVQVQITPASEHFDPDNANGFVLILALAEDDEQFRTLVSKQLADDAVVPVEWGEIKPFNPALNDWDEQETREAHGRLSDAWPVQYTTFYTAHKSGLNS